MKRAIRRLLVVLIFILRLTVILFALPIAGIYTVLFGWWLTPWMNRTQENQLKKELRQSAPSLFAEHGGKFVPNLQKPSAGSTAVTALADGILFQFNRWRDELTVRVAPETNPTELQELVALVKHSGQYRPAQQPANFFTLGQFDKFLVAHFDTIRAEIRDRSKQQRAS
jgi:hypothetical protein